MKRYLITNPQYPGAVEIVYYNRVLQVIDFSKAIMEIDTMKRFKSAVPVSEADLQKSFSSDTTIIVTDIQITFEMFWNEYCKYPGNRTTVKVNKKRAQKTWMALKTDKQVKAFIGIGAYDTYLKREAWRNKADPDTYLVREMFEDEY